MNALPNLTKLSSDHLNHQIKGGGLEQEPVYPGMLVVKSWWLLNLNSQLNSLLNGILSEWYELICLVWNQRHQPTKLVWGYHTL